MLGRLLLHRVNDMDATRQQGDKLFTQSLINLAGTETVEEIMRDMDHIVCSIRAAMKTFLYLRTSR